MNEIKAVVNATNYEPKDRHPIIFNTFEDLKTGEKMELINDHDPKPLKYQFMYEKEGRFEWEYKEEGPALWKVIITKK